MLMEVPAAAALIIEKCSFVGVSIAVWIDSEQERVFRLFVCFARDLPCEGPSDRRSVKSF